MFTDMTKEMAAERMQFLNHFHLNPEAFNFSSLGTPVKVRPKRVRDPFRFIHAYSMQPNGNGTYEFCYDLATKRPIVTRVWIDQCGIVVGWRHAMLVCLFEENLVGVEMWDVIPATEEDNGAQNV